MHPYSLHMETKYNVPDTHRALYKIADGKLEQIEVSDDELCRLADIDNKWQKPLSDKLKTMVEEAMRGDYPLYLYDLTYSSSDMIIYFERPDKHEMYVGDTGLAHKWFDCCMEEDLDYITIDPDFELDYELDEESVPLYGSMITFPKLNCKLLIGGEFLTMYDGL